MKNLWDEKEASKAKDSLDLLVYRSRLIGSEPKLCVWGGGNTSTKVTQKDHLGRERRVLLIKGSGSDLKASTRKDFPPVAIDDLLAVFGRDKMTDEEMVDYVSRCLLEPKAPRPSIEVLLHAFVDQTDIDHTHADAILSITNTENGRAIARKIFGDELLWVPYVKPGFTLAKWVGEAYRKNPEAKGLILEKHGLITWGPDSLTSYSLTIEMISRAEKFLKEAEGKKKSWSPREYASLSPQARAQWCECFLPVIRSRVGRKEKVILHFNDSNDVLDFVNARGAAEISQEGPATPDHMLRTKRIPLYLKCSSPENITEKEVSAQIEGYAKAHENYYNRFKKHLPEGPFAKMLDPYPKVILVPGVGMITTGSSLKNAKIVSEIYEHSISVMKNASTIDRYRSLSEKLAFEMDYWPMELYKLSLAPPEAEFSRQIGFVTGAARGIGRAIAAKLVQLGAHVFLGDIDFPSAQEAAESINKETKSNRAQAVRIDVSDETAVQTAFKKIVLSLGGLDFIVSNAGIAHVSSVEKLTLPDWEKSLAVNATGHFLVAREAVKIIKRQGQGGNLVFITTKNVLAPGKDFGAYSASKAAEAQLARVLAIENADAGIRVNMINPDGVFEDSGLWETIGENRAKSYGIEKEKLADFYKNRNLMKTAVYPEDVAEAAAFLLSPKSSKTTGCILTVDGGVKEAFPR